MNTSSENVIILDIIKDRSAPQDVSRACTDLNNIYYTQNAQANTPYTFNWGSTDDTSSPLRLEVGAAVFLVAYHSTNQKVNLFGVCGVTDYDDFTILNEKLLQYDDGSLAFTVEFQWLNDTNQIIITIEAAGNTTLAAKD